MQSSVASGALLTTLVLAGLVGMLPLVLMSLFWVDLDGDGSAAPLVLLNFEVLPVEWQGSSAIPVPKDEARTKHRRTTAAWMI